jgi:dTDP-4-dehydrorhamnose reductase/beta-phosphoglucomutase-like phosphatase (HAD superfamily)
MTILVCGASGLVGSELCSVLKNHNIDFIGTYNKNKIEAENMFYLNFLSISDIESFLSKWNITVCVFLIVQRLTDVCETNWDNIKAINIDMVNNTSFLCAKMNIKFIHLSTDYVFDGSIQPNFPDSLTNPLQNYGISKLISELKVKSHKGNYCIIRTPVLYSENCKIHENAVSLIAKNIMNLSNIPVREDNFCIRRPLHVYDLSLFILSAIQNDYKGIYHFFNPYNSFTKYQICEKIASILNVSCEKIIPNNSGNGEGVARRPYDTMLQDDKYNIYDCSFTDFDDSLHRYFQKYSHTKINNNSFVLIDLDGTLVNSSYAHYSAYKNAYFDLNYQFMAFSDWKSIISNGNINDYLSRIFKSTDTITQIKTKKKKYMQKESIQFTKNSEFFLKHLLDNKINFAVVTNTDLETVEIFKTKLPLLNQIQNWVTRNDYTNAKPSSDCYKLAIDKHYSGEKYIIGIEDTQVGLSALKPFTNRIYMYCENGNEFSEKDCYIFDDFNKLI